jgi:hypothetical protein
MILPKIFGCLPNNDKIIYCACDELYFNLYGKILINSITQHTDFPIHFHLYNPCDETLDKYYTKINISYEYLNQDIFNPAFDRWNNVSDQISIKRKNDMVKDWSDTETLFRTIVKTYYACTRFIRLAEMLTQPKSILMLDVDSIIRRKLILPETSADICIYEKNHKKHVPYTQHLASTIYYTGSIGSFNLIKDHANLIIEEYNKNEIYWFLDQDTLDIAIQKYNKSILDLSFVDFNFKNDSTIWCAKGPRKHKPEYQAELAKYKY